MDDDLDDDEEDDEAEEDEDEEGEAADDDAKPELGLTVIMRGFVKAKDATSCEWSGSWAMSAEEFDKGDKSKFKYDIQGIVVVDNVVKSVQPKGVMSGVFLVKDEKEQSGFLRIDEASVDVEFTPGEQPNSWKIKGKGTNINGEFLMEGDLDGAARKMALMKSYIKQKRSKNDGASSDGSDSDDDEDDDEEVEDDPTELADLHADAVMTGMIRPENIKATAPPAKPAAQPPAEPDKKKSRIVEDDE